VAKTRTRLQRASLQQLIFIDQAQIKVGNGRLKGLAPKGKPAIDMGKTARSWGLRVDIMAAISGVGRVSLALMTATDRKEADTKGWRKRQVLRFIRVNVAGYVRRNGITGAVVVVDKALRVKAEEVKAEMENGHAVQVAPAVVMPTSTAKYISPLDNNLWHQLKHAVRKQNAQTEDELVAAIRNEWQKISFDSIHNYYRHCALTRGADPYYGRPE
jgi:hypothetical protein